MEAREGGLFVSVTLPNILVGSVGGGTGLPSQSAALRMMGLYGPGKAAALAEIVAVLCLCGEISIVADLINEFDLTLDSAVLFWDISPVNDIPLHENLERLIACADVSGLAGMIVGANTLVEPERWASTVSSVLDDVLPGLACPVVVNADLSHFGPSWIVPYGEQVMLGDETGIVFPRDLPAVGRRA